MTLCLVTAPMCRPCRRLTRSCPRSRQSLTGPRAGRGRAPPAPCSRRARCIPDPEQETAVSLHSQSPLTTICGPEGETDTVTLLTVEGLPWVPDRPTLDREPRVDLPPLLTLGRGQRSRELTASPLVAALQRVRDSNSPPAMFAAARRSTKGNPMVDAIARAQARRSKQLLADEDKMLTEHALSPRGSFRTFSSQRLQACSPSNTSALSEDLVRSRSDTF